MNTTSERPGRLPRILAAIVIWLAAPLALADDTDIYLRSGLGGGTPGTPLVMMTLDLRPNLGSVECSNATAGCSGGVCSCMEHLGGEVFRALDLVDGAGAAIPDGIPDYSQHSEADLGTAAVSSLSPADK